MIYVLKNTTNKIVLTLDESSQLSTPFYLFELENQFNLNKIYWMQTDLSTNCRYNLFELDDNAGGSTTGGTFTALNLLKGQYTYTVYESTGVTLFISGTTGRIVETGRMVVATDNFFTDNSITNSIYM